MSKKRRKTTKAASSPSLIAPQRKKEILGFVLGVLSLLVMLAVVTYAPGDAGVVRSFSLNTALDPGDNRATNALGLVGAKLAYVLVPAFLGYSVLVFPLLGLAWAYVLFRNREPVYLPLLTLLSGLGAFILASLFGWFALTLEVDLFTWAGGWGTGTAGWMDRVFGTVGSFILLLSFLLVAILLIYDHDIQRSLDRLEEVLAALRDRFMTWWNGMRDRQGERREARAERREALRAERARQAEQAAARPKPASSAPARPAPRPSPPPPAPTPRAEPARSDPAPSAPAAATLNDRFRNPEPAAPPTVPARPPAEAPGGPTVPSAPEPATAADEPGAGLELKVRDRIEEEKAAPVRQVEGLDDLPTPFDMPPIGMLDEASDTDPQIDYDELEQNKSLLLEKLETYKIEITDINAVVGPTVTLYELTPAPGVKISKITSLEDDLAMAMAARGIRMIAPIPGKSAIGVEVPNRHRELVRVRDVIETARFRDAKMELPLVVGKTIEGEVFLQDLTKMPHILIAGATGAGKSVGVNVFIAGLLYACPPANLKFVMIDPKKIELQQYNRIVDHYIAMPEDSDDPIITDFSQALGVLKSCEREMENRYDLLSKAGVRSIKDYNKKVREGRVDDDEGHRHLPYIVVIIDELADLMMTAGKDIEGPIARLAQMARAVGIHLILATQRPSVDVITGLIKANFPARIAYQVASKIDSRTILDQNGAEGLVGNGDLLFMLGSRLIRLQGPYVSVDEIDRLADFIADQPGAGPYQLPPLDEEGDGLDSVLAAGDRDELFQDAARVIVRSQQGSVSLLQRKLSVGYSRAARIVDQLEDAGIVGPFEGSKARQVLVESEVQLDELFKTGQVDTGD